MKICVIGDPHFANHAVFGRPTAMPGVNSRLVRVMDTMNWIATQLDERPEVEKVVILGDITHNHGVLTPPVLTAIQDCLTNLCRHDREVTVISGNHDLDMGGQSIIRALRPELPDPYSLRLYSWLQDGPQHERLSEYFAASYISYGANTDHCFDQLRRAFPEWVTKIAFMHHSFEGAVHGAHEFQPPGGLNPKDIPHGIRVISGHFHKRQWIRDEPMIMYTGGPLQHSFGEATYEPGFMILELTGQDDIDMEFIETPAEVAPRFHILPHDFEGELPGYPGQDYYRIDLPSDVDPSTIAGLRDGLHNVVVKPIPVSVANRSRVEEYLAESAEDEDFERPVEIDDTIEVYTALHVEDPERASTLVDLGKELVQKVREE